MTDKYFEEELRYLYESGKEFAAAHPDRARFLNIDAVGDRDPYVERLFEGFAFLTGRIREKLDDSFPELTEGLINLLWPAFLKEIPSVSIVQFRPRPGLLHESRILARGCEVLSGPVGPESIPCRFMTTQEVCLNPVAISAVEKATDNRGNGVLKIKLSLDNKASWDRLRLSPLSLYIHAERPAALAIRDFLTSRVASASLSVNSGQAVAGLDPAFACTAGGLGAMEALMPAEGRVSGASALLLEYFTYAEKYFFVNLWGTERLPACDMTPESLEWTFTFNGDLDADVRVSAANFRLFCSPAVNLYKADIEPVSHSGKQNEYRLTADASHPSSCDVHSVISVTGIDRITGRRAEYEHLYTFKNMGSKSGRTFSTRRAKESNGIRRTYLVLGGDALDGLELKEQSLAIEAWCTNGVLAREETGENAINRGGREFPDSVMVTNITRPTLPCNPPESGEYLWVFLSHQGSNYMSMATAEALKSFIKLYNWSTDPADARRIEAITDVAAKPAERMAGAGVVRGVRFEVSLTESYFSSVSDIRLFGDVLKEFLCQYVSINSFLDLAFVLKPSGQTMSFLSKEGRQWLI
jgi:type VI secretion system protein ImpG